MFILSSKGKEMPPGAAGRKRIRNAPGGLVSRKEKKSQKNLYKIVDKYRVMVYNIVNNKERAERQKVGYYVKSNKSYYKSAPNDY